MEGTDSEELLRVKTQKTQIDPELVSSRELGTNLPSKGNKITNKLTKHESPELTVYKKKTYRSLINRLRKDRLILDRILIMVIPVFFDHILVHLDDDKKSYALNILEAADEAFKRRHRGIETYFGCLKYYLKVLS